MSQYIMGKNIFYSILDITWLRGNEPLLSFSKIAIISKNLEARHGEDWQKKRLCMKRDKGRNKRRTVGRNEKREREVGEKDREGQAGEHVSYLETLERSQQTYSVRPEEKKKRSKGGNQKEAKFSCPKRLAKVTAYSWKDLNRSWKTPLRTAQRIYLQLQMWARLLLFKF